MERKKLCQIVLVLKFSFGNSVACSIWEVGVWIPLKPGIFQAYFLKFFLIAAHLQVSYPHFDFIYSSKYNLFHFIMRIMLMCLAILITLLLDVVLIS